MDARRGDALGTSWSNLILGLRIGKDPRVLLTTTPKRVKLIRELMGRDSTAITNDTTYANLDNLAPLFREQVVQAYEGTTIGRQELLGQLLTDVDGALWSLERIDELRLDLAQ
jgi:phage terminase large subunit-like protein